MSYSDVGNLSLPFIAKGIVDSTFEERASLNAMKQHKAIKQTEGGHRVDVPLILGVHSESVDTVQEATALGLNFNDISENGSWALCANQQTAFIGSIAKGRNTGANQIVSVWETRLKNAIERSRDALNTRICADPVSGRYATLASFNGMSTSTGPGQAVGFFEGLAFGSQTNTVGDVSKLQYSNTWQHQYASGGGAFSNSGVDDLEMLIMKCRHAAGEMPHLGIAGASSMPVLRKALSAKYGAQALADRAGIKATFGYGDFEVAGVPFMYEPELTNAAGSTTTLLSILVLNLNDICLYHSPGKFFDVTDVKDGIVGGVLGDYAVIETDVALTARRLTGSGVMVHSNAS